MLHCPHITAHKEYVLCTCHAVVHGGLCVHHHLHTMVHKGSVLFYQSLQKPLALCLQTSHAPQLDLILTERISYLTEHHAYVETISQVTRTQLSE